MPREIFPPLASRIGCRGKLGVPPHGRDKHRRYRLYAWALLSCFGVLLCSCTRQTTVNGSVFIVTTGSVNVKLGLVVVAAYPGPVITKHFKDYNVRLMDTKREDEIQQKIKDAPYNSYKYKQALQEQAAWEELNKSRERDPIEFVCSSLPAPIATATTDADGKFSMTVPTAGDIVFVAHSSRQVGSEVEQYYWFCEVRGGGSQPKSVLLSNQNLLTEDSAKLILQGVIPSA